MKRRIIDLQSADEIIQDIEGLRKCGYERTGRWNLSQICEHLTMTMDGGMDGFGFRLPWLLRVTVIKWAFHHGLKTRKLGKGFPTFKRLQPKAAETDDELIIDQFIASCRRAETFSGSLDNYPFLDGLSVEDWRSFMWIHASHHLSFLVPRKTP